jgi:hypothetical protein
MCGEQFSEFEVRFCDVTDVQSIAANAELGMSCVMYAFLYTLSLYMMEI